MEFYLEIRWNELVITSNICQTEVNLRNIIVSKEAGPKSTNNMTLF